MVRWLSGYEQLNQIFTVLTPKDVGTDAFMLLMMCWLAVLVYTLFYQEYSKKAGILTDRRMNGLSDRSPCSIAHKPRQTLNTARTVLMGTFSSFRNKSHTGRHAAKQGANLAVQLKNGFDRNSYRRFTVLYRSEIATNAQHRANGFGG